MDKLIITVALTGNVPTKEMNPHLPVTADEIAADVRRCANAGAVLFHVHARDQNQKPTLDIDVYKKNARRIREIAPEVILQLSTGARAGKEWEARANPVRLLPEMGSFTTGSNNLPGIVYENSPQFIEYLAGVFKETGVKPEIEAFDLGDMWRTRDYIADGLFDDPPLIQLCMGVKYGVPATTRGMVAMCDMLPESCVWGAFGIGARQMPMVAQSVLMGGNGRAGLEDNLYLEKGVPATNAQLVERAVEIIERLGSNVSSVSDARKTLKLRVQ